MGHFLDDIDEIYESKKNYIINKYPGWKIDGRFTTYTPIIPNTEGIKFSTTLQLKKMIKTSVIFEQEYEGRTVRFYFDEYNIICTLIYIYDNFNQEGKYICDKMHLLINDNGEDISFKINDKKYEFKGIKYMPKDKKFLTLSDYEIGINDFICLVNLVIEKDRYSKQDENGKKDENGKSTILKYLLFLFLFSKKTSKEFKAKMIEVLQEEKIYKGDKLINYKKIINAIGSQKIYFDNSLSNKILCYNNNEES
ncbi:hypothetical protein psyc5s11_45320 [Clostridium gelidum]|uniref:Uncharacterized protein n=1 Tax=Clostridium gelidum TaxID=704125 RepID=A0ABN6J263_9CLOT|nr:hypothetical protein [Clostridium gelidum]BCZ48465.1 hypothetical protein psyc5s11_45320 [Clostridium gelidum]